MDRGRKHFWISLSAITLLAILCGAIAVLQYRWTGEISEAERQRLRNNLQGDLEDLRLRFNEEISGAARRLQPSEDEIQQFGLRGAYEAPLRAWKESGGVVFSRIGLAERHGASLEFLLFDPESFSPAKVPNGWADLWTHLEERARRGAPPRSDGRDDSLLEMPLFGGPGDEPGERAWLILELDTDYVRAKLLPELVQRYLSTGGKLDYQVDVVSSVNPQHVIYRPGAEVQPGNADGEIQLLDDGPGRVNPGGRAPGSPPPGFGRGKQGRRDGKGKGDFAGKIGPFGGPPRGGGPSPMLGAPGRWTLRVQHQAGSLEALVAQTRRRNLAVSAGLLVLILATSLILVRYARRMRELAEVQMNFVAGVSHELRTPLAVMRTAAYNLRRAPDSQRVEAYGSLIEDESQKLSALVEQVLEFGRVNNGQAGLHAAQVDPKELIADAIEAGQTKFQIPGLRIDQQIPQNLPRIQADPIALSHILQNLIENALKYATNLEPWLGIEASVVNENGRWIEIRIADRGPGIPRDEQAHIFDPFFRGKQAVDDQVHGTGLGLSLVKKLVEAQGGTVRLESRPGAGSKFIVRMPAAIESNTDEVANLTS